MTFSPSLLLAGNTAQLAATALQFGRSGNLCPIVGLLSVLWIAFNLFTHRQFVRKYDPAECTRPRAWLPFELVGHFFRAAAIACYSSATGEGVHRRSNVALLGYICVLGLIRFTVNSSYARRLFLSQINLLSLASLASLLLADLHPLFITSQHYGPDRGTLGTMVFMTAAVLIAANSPREWSPPLSSELSNRWLAIRATAEETCSWLDYYFTFGRLTPLIWKGFRKNLTTPDLPGLPWYNSVDYLLRRILDARERKKKTLWTIVYFARAEIAVTAFYAGVLYASRIVSPYSLYKLLDYLANPQSADVHPFTWVFLMFCGSLIQLLVLQQHNFTVSRLGVRIKNALTAEIYQRALSSRELDDDFLGTAPAGGQGRSQPTAASQLTTLISNDITMITFAGHVIMVAVGVPITVILAMIGLYQIVGWTSLAGLAVIILCFPLPTWIVRSVEGEQTEAQNAQDSRISLASEYLGAIRIIKYFAWEDTMKDYINRVRANEQKHLWKIDVLYALMGEVTEFIPVLALLVIFGLYVGVLKQTLTAPVAFTTVTLIKMIKTNLYLLGVISPRLTRASISLGRIDKFFAATSPLQPFLVGELKVDHATFKRHKALFQLQNITIDFAQGGLNIITGPSGSGKTTLLLALLGEAICLKGQLTRPKDIAYSPQTPWLQSMSVRENILFNRPYVAERYRDVIQACCLSFDFDQLPEGDRTEAGENGSSLSGGQRARVGLARALYSNAPLIILDDVFSALDTKTAWTLWTRVFCTDFLKGKTVVLVSHMQWMFSQAEVVVTLENGKIESIRQNLDVARTAKHQLPAEAMSSEVQGAGEDDMALINTKSPKADTIGSITIDDEVATSGEKGRLMFLKYMLYFGGPGMVFLAMFGLVLLNAFMVATPWWLSFWVDTIAKDKAADIVFYLGLYVCINFATTIVHGLAMLIFARGAWVAGQTLHDTLISAVMNVPLSWHNTTPIGRIINRLSMDIDTLDQSLGQQLRSFLDELIRLLFQIGAVSVIFPLFLVPSAIATILGFICGELYSRAAVTIQRMASASQSPVISHFSESFSGMAVIRAHSESPTAFLGTLAHRLHNYARAATAHKDLDGWLQFRIDILTSLVTVFIGVMAIDKVNVLPAGLIGFSLSNARGLSNSILNMVGIMNDLDIELQSFHRVEEYCKLAPENADEKSQGLETTNDATHHIMPHWPRTGRVEYQNVTIRYDANGPDILKNINLIFEPGKRIAIVGRTGSGKSTLLLSLLRMATIASGQILLDGVDITTVPRKKLRRSISAVPQEASLFQGTVGFNLDPVGEIPESDLTHALEVCISTSSFQQAAAGADGEKLTLSSPVQSEGGNFSHGQRQILSLSRSLVHKSKLLLLDEATANMDHAADASIQDVLKFELSDARTQGLCLVTIAHRLRTTVNYDEVVVLSSGRVLEIGSPRALFAKQGAFYDMVVQSREQDILSKLS